MSETVLKKKLSLLLLKRILSIYFIVVFAVTAVHLAIEYAQTRNDIRDEIKMLKNVFLESLITALWAENPSQIKALANGIIKIPVITGVRITGRQSDLNVELFPEESSELFYQFDLTYRFENKAYNLGTATFYSDNSVVFDRVKVGFLLLFLSALIRSVILTMLFIWAVNKYLNKPLLSFTDRIEAIDIEDIDKKRFSTNTEISSELHRLNDVFGRMYYKIGEHIENITKMKNLYQNIFDNAQVGIYQADTEGKLLTLNKAMSDILGYDTEKELISRNFNLKDLLNTSEYDCENFLNHIEREGHSGYETVIVSKDGLKITCELSAFVLCNREGEPNLIEGMLQDLSERKEKEKALIESRAAMKANQAKSEFLARMSHEIRTPMNAIIGFSQLINNDRTLAPEHRANVEIIQRSGEHLLKLINDVLDISKIEANRTTLNENDFDLNSLLTDLKEMLGFQAEKKGLSFNVRYGQNIPQYIRTDETKLRQILVNLIGNAIKFTNKGSVTLRADNKTSGFSAEQNFSPLFFTIEDTGPGISEEEIKILFEPFAQTETGRQAQEGTGLGLPISRKFVQLMGGDITVKSTIGRGSVFSFDIKAVIADARNIQSPSVTRKPVSLEPGQSVFRILIADDNPDGRKLLFRMLADFGFDIRDAENGEKALEIWREWQPHLILTDIHMPLMDGYETVMRIRSEDSANSRNPANSQCKIIALTASSFEDERPKLLESGFDDFLRKPFRYSELFDLINQHIGVRFVYSDTKECKTTESEANAEITREIFTDIPEDIFSRLKNSAILGDIEQTDNIIDEIGEIDKDIAKNFSELACNFDFERIIGIIDGKSM